MKKIKVTYNVKPKRTEQLETSGFEDMEKKIYQIFELQEGSLKYMKPRIKDQPSFEKEVKEGTEVLITGKIKAKVEEKEKEQKPKELTPEESQKKKKQEEELKIMKEELKLNPHDKVIKRLQRANIKQRAIMYYNTDIEQFQDLGVDYALCPLYLLKLSKEFKDYCKQYKIMHKNPDGLIIEELGLMFTDMEKYQGVVCPLNWISSWICYCSDDIEYPYPTYPVDYFLNRLFSTMKMAFDVELQKKEEEPNSRMDCGTKFFGIEVLTKRRDITKLDEDDQEQEKDIEKKAIKYFLECDLGKPEFSNVILGIHKRFDRKKLWRNFYAFDIQFEQEILSFERLPKYLLIHCSRWGYPEARQEWEEIDFTLQSKSYHKVKIPRIIDLFDFCDNNLKEKLEQGRYERDQMFYPYHMDDRYPEFINRLEEKNEFTETELNYMFLDHILFVRNIYHQFWFEPIKNSKPTGEYRIIGVVMHKGDYYHRPDSTHQHPNDQNCKGEYMAFVYQQKRGGRWLKYYHSEVSYVDLYEVTNPKYWGKRGQWTPVLYMYQQVYMINIQVEPPSEPRRDRASRTHRRGGA